VTDEEYVRANWEWAACWEPNNDVEFGHDEWIVGIADKACSPSTESRFDANSKAGAWSAAAEFTRERLEQIRQLDEEIEVVAQQVVMASNWIVSCGENLEGERCAKAHIEKWSRILARLEAALAELRQGMTEPKP
jgi:hypothetical protein